MTDPIEFWQVQMPNGSVCTMTLDELDAAFQGGRIDEGTYVLKAGDASWATLGALLGLDAPVAPVASVTPPPVVLAPVSYPPPSSAPVYSLRPVVSEIDDSELEFGGPQFRSSKKRSAIIAGSLAGAALLGIAVAVLGSSDGTPVAAKPSSVAVAAAAPPPVVATPAPVEATTLADRLTDAQKKALADADKTRATQTAQKAAARMNAAPPRSTYKSNGKPVFHKGGNTHDPLNSSL